MLTLKAKQRKIIGKKVKSLRKQGVIPGVLYGPKIKEAISLEVNKKDFKRVFKEAGESSLISLAIDEGEENLALVHQTQKGALDDEFIHIDFYQPDLTKKTEVNVSLVFEGESLAVKELSGTLVKNISEIVVKALPQKLPKEIKVDISKLKTFDDEILVKDLEIPEGVEIMRDSADSIAVVVPATKVEEELEKPIEEKVEDIEKVGEGEETAEKAEEKAEPAEKKEGEEKKEGSKDPKSK